MINRCLSKISLIFIFLLLISMSVVFAKENFTGTPVTSFQGIEWKAGQEQIERWALDRNAKFIDASSKYNGVMTTLIYKGTYGDEQAEYRFTLYKGQFYQVNIYCESISESVLLDRWQKFKQLLSQKYGNPSYDFYFFKSPYYNGDGYELQAIRLNKGTAKTYWNRPIGDGDNAIVSCEVTPMMSLRVTYQHVEIADIAVDDYNRQKSRDM